ncbi:unnamed protein product [Caenorhabditis angaria]|uniref:L-Fucosyltransferase n=1 Tax=Caenorhabditis angaria TaxID=860376 RepID=A0A9P1MT48_9PELO|nr:unnamed protein product [Caenorhabditis angaria]
MARFSISRYSTYLIFFLISIYFLIFATRNENPNQNRKRDGKYENNIQISKVFPQNGNEETLENVPWKIENVKVEKLVDLEISRNKTYLISDFEYSNGLGNLLFQVASLISIASSYNSILLLPNTTSLRRAFSLNSPNIQFISPNTYQILDSQIMRSSSSKTLKSCCKYEEFTLSKNNKFEKINGFFQNFRYFHKNREELLSIFDFIEPVQQKVEEFMESVGISLSIKKAKLFETNVANDDQAFEADPENTISTTMIVGVHIRHGIDITMNSRNRKHGHIEAPIEYYIRSMEQIANVYEDVAFIICSDDMSWVRRRLKLKDSKIPLYYCPGPREVDMAILAQCDSIIISTGTFGWWAAYLNKNNSPDIYYYKHWPAEGSMMSKMLNKTEYFLENWVSLE